MILADIPVASGDPGGGVLVRGLPGGVISRSFGGSLGFTPLAEDLPGSDWSPARVPTTASSGPDESGRARPS